MRSRKTAINLPRALPGLPVRMEAPSLGTINAAVENLNRTFEQFKAQNDAQIAELKRGRDDVVTRETADKLNNAVSDMQAELTALNRKMAAAATTDDADPSANSPARKAYAKAFAKFVRKGVEAELPGLAVQAAMTSDSDPDGGFLVPEEMEAGIARVALNVSAMRSISDVRATGTSVSKRLRNIGGANASWVGEKDPRSQTNTPQFAEVAIPVHEMSAMPGVTQSLLDDATEDVGGVLESEVAIAFADLESPAFVSGDGINKPRGFLGYTNVANASYAWGKIGYTATGAAATFNATDAPKNIIDLFYSLKSVYRATAVFVANDATIGTIRVMKDGNGQYLWHPATQPGGVATVLGKEIVTEDNMPAIGANAFPLAFGDFKRGYAIRDRVGMRVLRDPFTSKPYVLFYTTKRVGGGVVDFAAIKTLKCAAS